VAHFDGSMSTIDVKVDDRTSWGLVIDPNPAMPPYSIVELD
jgi:hypothetical protein